MTDGEAITGSIPAENETATEGRSSIAKLAAEIAPEIRRFVVGVIRDSELADDILQATVVKAIEQGDGVRLETARGWLFQVAFREALVVRRRQAVRDKGQQRLAGFRIANDPAPEVNLLRGETVEAVREALDKIPDEQRRVILARIYEDKTFAQIASETGLPIGTVLTRMRRGLEKLRNSLRPGG